MTFLSYLRYFNFEITLLSNCDSAVLKICFQARVPSNYRKD